MSTTTKKDLIDRIADETCQKRTAVKATGFASSRSQFPYIQQTPGRPTLAHLKLNLDASPRSAAKT